MEYKILFSTDNKSIMFQDEKGIADPRLVLGRGGKIIYKYEENEVHDSKGTLLYKYYHNENFVFIANE